MVSGGKTTLCDYSMLFSLVIYRHFRLLFEFADRLRHDRLAQQQAHTEIDRAACHAGQAALDDQHQLALVRRDEQRVPAVEHERHRRRGGAGPRL